MLFALFCIFMAALFIVAVGCGLIYGFFKFMGAAQDQIHEVVWGKKPKP